MVKKLYILTGPPGSGKTTHARKNMSHLEVFDADLGNKMGWQNHYTDAVLMTSAPSYKNKQHWLRKAIDQGFDPVLFVMWVPRMLAYDRMKKRSGLTSYERNDLEKSVERWYKLYEHHPLERRITNE